MDGDFIKCVDPKEGRTYYYCKDINVATWTIPKREGVTTYSRPNSVSSDGASQSYIVKVLYDYSGPCNNSKDTFEVHKGDMLWVIKSPQNGWIGVVLIDTNKCGFIPESYVSLVLPPGDPPTSNIGSRRESVHRIHISLTATDLRDMRKELSNQPYSFQLSDNKKLNEHGITPTKQTHSNRISTTTNFLLYHVYVGGILSGQSITPKQLALIERYRLLYHITEIEHIQVLGNIGWTKENYDKMLVNAGIETSEHHKRGSQRSYATFKSSSTNSLISQEVPADSIQNEQYSESDSHLSSLPAYSTIHGTDPNDSEKTSSSVNPFLSPLSPRIVGYEKKNTLAHNLSILTRKEDKNTNYHHKYKTSEETLHIEDIDRYSFVDYAKTYFQRDKGINVFNRPSLNDLTTFSHIPPTRPLTKIEGPNAREAVEVCITIMKYMGDLTDDSETDPVRYLNMIHINTMYSNELHEEAICFILKQIQNNPNFEHEIRGWRLIPFLISCRKLTTDRPIYPYLIQFIADSIYRQDRISGITLYAFKLLVEEEKLFNENTLMDYENRITPHGVFDTTLEDVFYLEEIADLLSKYGVKSINHGLFGSQKQTTNHTAYLTSGDQCLSYLFKGTLLLKKTRANKAYKERFLWTSPFINAICWNKINSNERTKVQSLDGIIGVLKGPPPGIQEPDELFRDRYFSLSFDTSFQYMDLVASNSAEAKRCCDYFRYVINWYQSEGKSLYYKLLKQLSSDEQETIRKVLTENDIGLYGKNIQNMHKELTNSFKRFVDDYNKKELQLLSPQIPFSSNPSTQDSGTIFFPNNSPIQKKGSQGSSSSSSSYLSPISKSSGTLPMNGLSGTVDSSSSVSIAHHINRKHIPLVRSKEAFSSDTSGDSQNGVSSVEDPLNRSHLHVPRILLSLDAALTRIHAWEFEGIFRIPGSKSKMEEAASSLSLGYYESLNKLVDPYLIGSILKNWLRSLKNPIIPESLYMAALQAKETVEVLQVISQLPESNRNVLLYICKLLKHYTKYTEFNKMTPDTFAICISPTLLRIANYSTDKMDQELHNMLAANSFISKCISLVDIELAHLNTENNL